MISDFQMLVQIPHELAQNWGWFLALGIGLVVLGLAAVVRSFAATVASMLFFGWLLVAASGIEIAQAVMVGHWAGFFQHVLAAIDAAEHAALEAWLARRDADHAPGK